MKWHTRLIASVYDTFLCCIIALAVLWLTLLITVVPYGPHAWLVLLAPAIFVIFFADRKSTRLNSSH